MPKLVLVRHGQTVHNRLGLIQGRTDTELSPEGEAQARKLAVELREEPFDRVYSSPLKRAFRTAEIIVQGRDIAITTDDRLVEIDQGDWTSQKGTQLFMTSEHYKEWVRNPTAAGPPNGETIYDVLKRVNSFFGDVKGDNILLVAHGGVIAVMRTVLESHPLAKAWELLPRNGQAITLSIPTR